MDTIQRKRLSLASAVLSQYTRVTNDDDDRHTRVAEFCNTIVTSSSYIVSRKKYKIFDFYLPPYAIVGGAVA